METLDKANKYYEQLKQRYAKYVAEQNNEHQAQEPQRRQEYIEHIYQNLNNQNKIIDAIPDVIAKPMKQYQAPFNKFTLGANAADYPTDEQYQEWLVKQQQKSHPATVAGN